MGHPCFASDQYAPSVVIYEWICGDRPFQGTALGLTIQHMNTPPPPLRDSLPELSQEVEQVILKALAKAPEDRFECIQQFADALREAARCAPVPHPECETSLTDPLTPSERIARLSFGPKPEELEQALIKESISSGPTIQVADIAKDPSRNRALPSPKKHLPDRRSSLLIGGILGLISLLVILIITLKPILFVRGEASPLPTTQHHVPSVPPIQQRRFVEKWLFPTGGPLQSEPTVVDGVLYVSSMDHNVYAINASTGRKIWAIPAGRYSPGIPVPENGGSPTVVNGVLYIGTGGNLRAINASSGQAIWSFPYGAGYSAPTVADGVLYIGDNSSLCAINARDGQKIWSFPTNSYVVPSPAMADGLLYVGSDDNNVYAINASTRHLVWSFPTGAAVTSSPTVVDGVVYVGSLDDNVYEINASTGHLIWSFPSSTDFSSGVANGVLYVSSYDYNVYAINASTGQKIARFPVGLTASSPIVVNGVLYVASNEGNVYALTLSPS